MAITAENTVRERSRREAIDEMLLKVVNIARENDQAALRLLRTLLLSASPESQTQTPERLSRPGWLGEIQDALEAVIGDLEDTAKVLEEVYQQVATQVPSPTIPPRR